MHLYNCAGLLTGCVHLAIEICTVQYDIVYMHAQQHPIFSLKSPFGSQVFKLYCLASEVALEK